jgi:DNA helicase IV
VGLSTGHPELAQEQAWVDHAYECAAALAKEIAGYATQGFDIFEREAYELWRRTRIAALADTVSPLVFGRIDQTDGERWYVGRHHVRDGSYETVVVDWRAPVSEPFYQATRRDPMSLRRRRHFLAEGRSILGISDDHLDSDGLRGNEILQADLARRRGGEMRDVVATIQAEQDAIIRAPLQGTVVVQGGPGTGKTAIGLHRAAYLLYTHRATLERRGVLVIGPNPVFIGYVSQVLPSLGEWAVTQVPVDGLAPFPSTQLRDAPGAARIKGDRRMAEVIRRALESRWGAAGEDVQMKIDGVAFAVTADEANSWAHVLRARRPVYREGRELLRDHLLTQAYRAYERAAEGEARTTASYKELTSFVRRNAGFKRILDQVWPSANPSKLVADLLSRPDLLRSASNGVLSDSEIAHVVRRGRRFTREDLPLLDEARALIEGAPMTYGHAVVDEAQDLSPMQIRMISRRCPDGSMTVLGDLAQATGAWAHDSWDEVMEHLPVPGRARLEELTLGYRICGEIVTVASRVLAAVAPNLRSPEAVRADEGEVVTLFAPDVGPVVAARAAADVGRFGATAVICPDALLEDVAKALDASELDYGLADHDGLSRMVTLVPVSQCKGLEFDAVTLVEPATIVDEGSLRLLYVAITRAMRSLAIVHSRELPAELV